MKKIFLLVVCVSCLCGCSCNKQKDVVPQMQLDLKGNPTTGYKWNCKIDNDSIVKIASNKYVENKKEEELGGTYKYVLEGSSNGMTTLSCSYMRSSEKEETLYSLEYVISVENKKMSLYSKEGTYFDEEIPMPKIIETT